MMPNSIAHQSSNSTQANAPLNVAPPSNMKFDLADLIHILWRQKIYIIITMSIMITLGFKYISGITKIYVAQSTIMLGSSEPSFSLPTSVSAFAGGGDSQIDMYMEFFRSSPFSYKVIDELELLTKKEFKYPQSDDIDRKRQNAAKVLQRNMSLRSVSNTEMVKITYESEDPKLAAQIANYIGPAFFDFMDKKKEQKTIDQSQWLNGQLTQMQSDLFASEKKLQIFLQNNQLIDITSQIDLASTEITALLQQRLMIEKALSESAEIVDQIKPINSDPNRLIKIKAIMEHPMVRSIHTQLLQSYQLMDELKKRYKHKHHKYIALVSKINRLEKEEADLVLQVADGFLQTNSTFQKRKVQIETQIQNAKSQHSKLGKHQIELARLKRELEGKQKLYELFMAKLQETEMLKDLGGKEDFAVVDKANVPKAPAKPKVIMLTFILSVFSFLVSFAFWFILYIYSDRTSRLKKVLRAFDIPLLAEIPKLGAEENVGTEAFTEGEKNYVFFEAIRKLRTTLMMSENNNSKIQNSQSSKNRGRIIAVTGLKDGDGKSTIAISLAQSFSNLNKTLLVDVDLRRPSIASAFKLKEDYPGITNLIGHHAKFTQCIYQVSNSELTIMPSGDCPPDPMMYISKPRFASIIRKFGVVYERVVVESPPVESVHDALVISKFVDGIIIVCDPRKTSSDSMIEEVQRMHETGVPLLGVVFNKVRNVRTNVAKSGPIRRLARKLIRRN